MKTFNTLKYYGLVMLIISLLIIILPLSFYQFSNEPITVVKEPREVNVVDSVVVVYDTIKVRINVYDTITIRIKEPVEVPEVIKDTLIN